MTNTITFAGLAPNVTLKGVSRTSIAFRANRAGLS
jgi:hypothetical protein